MNIPLINGVQHAWADIKINMFGRVLTGITSIEYGMSRKVEDHHGAGEEPVMRGKGQKTYKPTKLGLYGFEVLGLQKVSAGDITSIPPFEIIVQYKATANSQVVTDVLQNNQFMNNERTVKTGDTKIEVPLELITAGIKFQSV